MNAAGEPAVAAPAARVEALPSAGVDFERQMICILGLPFDAIGLQGAVERIRNAAFARRRCFVSTPNLNFAMAARDDPAFRGSVLRSDLSLVDGMPLVWIARLLGLPVRERVSGADVFAGLRAHAGPPLTAFLFGGPAGVAERACDAINRRGGGVRCVGFDEGGFGPVESMSGAAQIERINASGAQFVVVALGAKKGQAWIEHNAARLTAPVLSHLGAVVNFAAGSVRRAPRWVQWSGLEWLWRIKEEPALWRRYWHDGRRAAGYVVRRVLPDAVASRRAPWAASEAPRVEVIGEADHAVLHLHGAWRGDIDAVRAALARCAARDVRVTVDLSGATALGNALVATLLVAHGWFTARHGFAVVGARPVLQRALRRALVDGVLAPASE